MIKVVMAIIIIKSGYGTTSQIITYDQCLKAKQSESFSQQIRCIELEQPDQSEGEE